MRHIHYLCIDAGLSREDRLSLARTLLDYPEEYLRTFNDLTIDELETIVTALKSWKLIQEIRTANGSAVADAIKLVQDLDRSAVELTEEVVQEMER